ncbi:MAG TPA: WHG domain-containing protein [Dietzia timorensis]|uniref:WHG domain-containing protein n=1 Tax=Dietzia timorensis TaxID=499555 RepID=A0A921F4P6_9ACTN|nr:TetR/AcrR family transcriptional regulator [Dietzia timorensis]HJE91542.1 WHG domain-containing protein [Dietzia timorensis]
MVEKVGKRAAAREETMRRILEAGRAQLDRDGVEALSLREVSREIGVVSSAVYRYVKSRDELLTMLVVDCYNDVGDAVDAGDGAAADENAKRRYIEVAGRMRRWAAAHPERWTLLYGTPVRGYAAPSEQTNEPGTRVLARFMEIAGQAEGEGHGRRFEVDEGLEGFLAAEQEQFGTSLPAGAMVVAASLWSGTVGAITAELFGQWGPMDAAIREGMFAAQVRALSTLLGAE